MSQDTISGVADNATTAGGTRRNTSSGGDTIGVEEEFLLVDADSGATVPHAAAVLTEAAKQPCGSEDAALHPELLSSQVEAATGRCTTLGELKTQLRFARRQLGQAAQQFDARVLSSGTPIAAESTPAMSTGPRFRRIGTMYQAVVADYQACGCHTHVAVPDVETAVAVVNHLRPWLPTLLALSANSPFHLGQDTGYASWRMIQQARFPGSGVPPRFASARDYTAQLDNLVDCGVLVDTNMSFWLARPSPRLPTVEFRVADTSITVEETALQAALARALVRTALRELDRGHEAGHVKEHVAAAAVWSAARYGLRGPGVHPVHEVRVPAMRLVREMAGWIAPALDQAGETTSARATLRHVSDHGTGAERQRAAASSGPAALLDLLTAEAVPEPDHPETHGSVRSPDEEES